MGKTKFAIENATRCRIVLADQTYYHCCVIYVEFTFWDRMPTSPSPEMQSAT